MADIYTKQKRSEIMAHIRSRNTKPERVVRSVLHRMGLRFRLSASDLPGKPDVVLRSRRIVIFVNGCYWHRHDCPKGRSKAKTNSRFWAKKLSDNIARDRRTISRIEALGWRVLVIWECQTRDMDKLQSVLAEKLYRV